MKNWAYGLHKRLTHGASIAWRSTLGGLQDDADLNYLDKGGTRNVAKPRILFVSDVNVLHGCACTT